MKQFYLNLKLRDKLLSAFFLIAIILVSIGIIQYNTIKKLDDSKTEILMTIKARDAIQKIQYYIQGDMQILMQMMNSSDEGSVKQWWSEHLTQNEFIYQQVENLSALTTNSKSLIINNIKNATIEIGDSLLSTYEVDIEPKYAAIHDYKIQIFATDILPEVVFIDGTDFIRANEYKLSKTKIQKLEADISSLNTFISTNIGNINRKLDNLKTQLEIAIDEAEEKAQVSAIKSLRDTLIALLIGLFLSFSIAIIISGSIAAPIKKLNSLIWHLSKGELPSVMSATTQDEVGEMTKALNALVKGLHETSQFAQEIEKGNFESKYSPLSENDILGNALIDMRKSLQAANEEETKRKLEDRHRSWATEGVAEFGEILRHNTEKIELLGRSIIKKLVKYLDANQGGLFIINNKDENDIYLDLVAAYAYNRDKFFTKKVLLGEGLVGTCAIEKDTIYLEKIPDEYIEIESGLGNANPNCLLIVPLKMDAVVHGVVEIASFNRLEKHQIEFVERIADNVASTLSTVKMNSQTALLLKQSQRQAEEMASQEEEMRQNMEEMQATQEETERREEELKIQLEKLKQIKRELDLKDIRLEEEIKRLKISEEEKLKEINRKEKESREILETSLDGVIIINDKGIIEFFNKSAENLFNYSAEDVIGKNVKVLMPQNHSEHHDKYLNNYLTTNEKKIIGKGREVEILTKNKTAKIAHLSVIETSSGNNRKFTAFMRDISVEKKFAKERNILLEKMIASQFEYQLQIEKLKNILDENNINSEIQIEEDSEFISWSKNYELGIKSIDKQHKNLVDLINNFFEALKSGEGFTYITEVLEELQDYTVYHFGYEERLFKDTNYQLSSSHEVEHRKFIEYVIESKKEYEEGKIEVSYHLINFLKTWLLEHILIVDKQYVTHFNDCGIE